MSDYIARLRASIGHEVLLVPAAVACIRDDEGRVLLLRHRGAEHVWGFPGGDIEPGEAAAEALRREVWEEIGLRINLVGLIGIYSAPEYTFAYPNGDRVQPVCIFFDCRVVDGGIELDEDEIVGARYFAPDELPRMRPCCAAKARDAFAYQGQPFIR